MGESRPEKTSSCPTPITASEGTTIISITAWRIVMILALLAAIAAALLFVTGLDPNADSTQSSASPSATRPPRA